MKMQSIFALLTVLATTTGHSQEQVGHIFDRWFHHDGPQQQQQQQGGKEKFYKRIVITGSEAEILYLEYAQSQKVMDRSDCPWPVKMVQKRVKHHAFNSCFDRGDRAPEGLRYKCYVTHKKRVSEKKYDEFDRMHNSCGEEANSN